MTKLMNVINKFVNKYTGIVLVECFIYIFILRSTRRIILAVNFNAFKKFVYKIVNILDKISFILFFEWAKMPFSIFSFTKC